MDRSPLFCLCNTECTYACSRIKYIPWIISVNPALFPFCCSISIHLTRVLQGYFIGTLGQSYGCPSDVEVTLNIWIDRIHSTEDDNMTTTKQIKREPWLYISDTNKTFIIHIMSQKNICFTCNVCLPLVFVQLLSKSNITNLYFSIKQPVLFWYLVMIAMPCTKIMVDLKIWYCDLSIFWIITSYILKPYSYSILGKVIRFYYPSPIECHGTKWWHCPFLRSSAPPCESPSVRHDFVLV